MKAFKKTFMVSVLLSLTIFQSCEESQKVNTNLHLKGTVLNHKSQVIRFRQAGTNKVYSDSLDDEGNFAININDIEEGYFLVGKRENSFLYLMAGDTTAVIIDEKKYDSLVDVKKDFQEINLYLMASENIKITNKYYFSLSGSKLNDIIDSLYNEKQILLDKQLFSGKFIEQEKLRLYADSVYEKNTIDWEGVDRKELVFFNELNLNKYVALPNEIVTSVLSSLAQIETEPSTVKIIPNMYSSSYKYTNAKNHLINNKITDSIYKDFLLKKTMTYFVEEGKMDSNFLEVYEYGINSINNKKIQSRIINKYENRLKLAKGSRHPVISFENTKGELIKTTDSIFKNKLIYIDVWATWCPPCKAQTSHFIKLSKEYKNKDIEFIGISFDNSRTIERWIPYIDKHNLLSFTHQGITQDAMKKVFDDDYLISGIPRFILIDKNGYIIDADSPRPSETDKIKALIDVYL